MPTSVELGLDVWETSGLLALSLLPGHICRERGGQIMKCSKAYYSNVIGKEEKG